jgi:hypothetical protein
VKPAADASSLEEVLVIVTPAPAPHGTSGGGAE